MFNGTNKNCKESLFEVQFSLSSANGANYATQLHRWIGTEEFEGWDEITPSETLMNEFKKEGKLNNGLYDARLYASVFFQDPYFNDGTGKVYGYDWDAWICLLYTSVTAMPTISISLTVCRYSTLPIWKSR